ncbi:MAG: hypothetical protein E7213_00730 [Clostridium sp.]|nr:hypothetical protein [Clostridium sp.]
MKKLRSLATIVIGLLCLWTFVGCESNADVSNKDNKDEIVYEQNFILINQTGKEINDLYISPAAEEKWGNDILILDSLSSGKKTEVEFSTEVKTQYWDLKVIDKDRNEITWRNIDLFTVSELTLKLEGSVPITSIK